GVELAGALGDELQRWHVSELANAVHAAARYAVQRCAERLVALDGGVDLSSVHEGDGQDLGEALRTETLEGVGHRTGAFSRGLAAGLGCEGLGVQRRRGGR